MDRLIAQENIKNFKKIARQGTRPKRARDTVSPAFRGRGRFEDSIKGGGACSELVRFYANDVASGEAKIRKFS